MEEVVEARRDPNHLVKRFESFGGKLFASNNFQGGNVLSLGMIALNFDVFRLRWK